MNALFWWAIIIGGFLFTYRAAYRIIDYGDELDGFNNDATDRVFNAAIAFLIACLWPLAIIGWLVWRFATPQTARQMKARKRELEAQIRDREGQLAQRERELGLNLPPLPPRDD